MIEIVASGIVYRNPKPHLRAIHAWHPSLVQFDDGELLASFDLGQAVEALDYRTWLARSTDAGLTWSSPWRLFDDASPRRCTHSVRIGRLTDGTLTGFGARYHRDDFEEGLVNRDNLGYVSMDLLLLRSRDRGKTWDAPREISPPLVGPSFEMCHGIVELPDGRWLAPTSTWRGWHGESPHGMQAVALVSQDRGKTWPERLSVMNGAADGLIYWEQSLVLLAGAANAGKLLAVCWAFDEPTGKSLPNRYAISHDGRTFSAPRPTGFHGQTAKLTALPDGRVLCVYRGDAQPGLWACVAQIEGDEWRTIAEKCVWRGAASGMQGAEAAGQELSALKFGYPNSVALPDGDVLTVFWCVEDCIHNIRWLRWKIGG